MQLAALAVKAQGQFNGVAGPYQLLKLKHFHPAKTRRQVEQLLAQSHGPVHLHHARQHWGFGEVATEIGQIRRDRQVECPLALVFTLAHHFGLLGSWCEQ